MYYIEESNEVKTDRNPIAESNNLRAEISVLLEATKEYDQLLLDAENRKIQIQNIRTQMYKQLKYKQKMLLILENQLNDVTQERFGAQRLDDNSVNMRWKMKYDQNRVCANCGANRCDCGTDMIPLQEYEEKDSSSLPPLVRSERIKENQEDDVVINKRTEIISPVVEGLDDDRDCLRDSCRNKATMRIENPRFLKYSVGMVYLCDEHFKEKYPEAK